MEKEYNNVPSQEEVESLIEQTRINNLAGLLQDVHPADIAGLLDKLSPENAVIVFNLLPMGVASEVLDETGSLVRQELVEKVDDEVLADLLEELPMDDAAEFLDDLPEPVADRLLNLMEPVEAGEVKELLAYEDETAGRLMTRDVAALRRQWTVAETLDFLRSLEDAETLQYLYVIDRNDRLIGVVPLRALIRAQPQQTIETIMQPDVVSAPVDIDQEDLAEMVARYDYYAIPVTDKLGRFLGVVTVDDVVDVLADEMTEDIQRLGGSEPLEQPYFGVSVWQVARKRVGWLLLLFVAATFTGTVIRLFEEELQLVVALGFFIPLITGTGGNAGTQTVATIIRALTLNQVHISNLFSAWKREVVVGFLLGIAMGIGGFIRAILWDTGYEVALVVTFTLPVVVIWANTVATMVPILADHFDIDPTVISGPMITTFVDATGLMIYFGLARVILGL